MNLPAFLSCVFIVDGFSTCQVLPRNLQILMEHHYDICVYEFGQKHVYQFFTGFVQSRCFIALACHFLVHGGLDTTQHVNFHSSCGTDDEEAAMARLVVSSSSSLAREIQTAPSMQFLLVLPAYAVGSSGVVASMHKPAVRCCWNA
mmetsp:Transcript_12728/g.18711  ORF Transcript_12728/g.18711 Transcript_12728/m.18711 type:complete len:146 (-) Transcript_12728:1370-1807(-)